MSVSKSFAHCPGTFVKSSKPSFVAVFTTMASSAVVVPTIPVGLNMPYHLAAKKAVFVRVASPNERQKPRSI
jgi:hypothetical protein